MTIKEIRTTAKMTQATFAAWVGVTKSCVEKWEKFDNCPEHLRALIEYKMINEKIISNIK